MPEKKAMMEKLKNWLGADARTRLIVILGLLGMILIFISQFSGKNTAAKNTVPDIHTAQFTSEEYIQNLEDKLCNLISGMDGVGRARVMVTLESGMETVYAQEEKRNVDKTLDTGAAKEAGVVYQKENVEQRYILVDSEYGKKEALVLTRLEPKIQGVVIVCEGAGSARVEQSLVNVVTTALNIPSTRVCVVKISG